MSGSVTIHLLGINSEFTESRSNSTRFKLVSGAHIRFEQITTSLCYLRISPCVILEVGGKYHAGLFFFV